MQKVRDKPTTRWKKSEYTFKMRISIGRKEPPVKACIAWPPRSPDLMSCDLNVWGLIKDCVYVPPLPSDLSDLRHRIEVDVEIISSETVKKVWDELAYRLDLCPAAYIEHL
ncbi:uncharacterized protein TNCV_1070791 [Trichonephila clavipes]|nr:uncharacterized protein TNCV_1070791 [Trichonephila clavipes]